jgi:hypothetical protein
MRATRILLWMAILFLAVVSPRGIPPSEAAQLQIGVKAGQHYTHSYKWGIIKLRLVPQIALWLEDEKGQFAANIYITYRSATSKWAGGKDVRRPAALPVWSHRQGIRYSDGLYMPDRDHPLPDAVTGATPKDSFTKEWRIPGSLSPGKYVVWAEVNNSFDYNERYQKDLPEGSPDFNAENGQPSVVWRGDLVVGSKPAKIILSPFGHGHPMGKDGEIYTNMKGITDALQIVEDIAVEYLPGK